MIESQFGSVPGLDTAYTTYENAFAWGGPNRGIIKGEIIAAAAVDSGASPTYRLRPGLLLGKITSSGKLTNYSNTATDGSQVAYGVLMQGLRMQDVFSGSTTDKFLGVLVGGNVQASKIYNLDVQARADMFGRFVFDDNVLGNNLGWRRVVAKTGDYTVLTTDNLTLFTNLGAGAAVNFTLPTLALGYRFGFYCEADYELKITSAAADTIVTYNDVAADTVSLKSGTNSKQIGGYIEILANSNATKWLAIAHGWITSDVAGNTGMALTT